MTVVCNPIRMGRWSEPMVLCVCHSDEVIREAFPGSLVGESVCWIAKLEMLIECASWLLPVSVGPECQSKW